MAGKPGGKYSCYRIGLRNTEPVLLEDFCQKFNFVFGLRPHISKDIDRAYIGDKSIHQFLTSTFGSFYSHYWSFPETIFSSKELKAAWLRAVFDCEGWVYCKNGSDRHIGIGMVNLNGIFKIQSLLGAGRFASEEKGKVSRNTQALC